MTGIYPPEKPARMCAPRFKLFNKQTVHDVPLNLMFTIVHAAAEGDIYQVAWKAVNVWNRKRFLFCKMAVQGTTKVLIILIIP